MVNVFLRAKNTGFSENSLVLNMDMADVIACSVRKERISQMHGMEYQFYRLRKDFAAGDIGNRQTKTENLEYSRN